MLKSRSPFAIAPLLLLLLSGGCGSGDTLDTNAPGLRYQIEVVQNSPRIEGLSRHCFFFDSAYADGGSVEVHLSRDTRNEGVHSLQFWHPNRSELGNALNLVSMAPTDLLELRLPGEPLSFFFAFREDSQVVVDRYLPYNIPEIGDRVWVPESELLEQDPRFRAHQKESPNGAPPNIVLLAAGEDLHPEPGVEVLLYLSNSSPRDYSSTSYTMILFSWEQGKRIWSRPIINGPTQILLRDTNNDGCKDILSISGATFNGRVVGQQDDMHGWLNLIDGSTGQDLLPPRDLGMLYGRNTFMCLLDNGDLMSSYAGKSMHKEIMLKRWRLPDLVPLDSLHLPLKPVACLQGKGIQGRAAYYFWSAAGEMAVLADWDEPARLLHPDRKLMPLGIEDYIPQLAGDELLLLAGDTDLLVLGADMKALAALESTAQLSPVRTSGRVLNSDQRGQTWESDVLGRQWMAGGYNGYITVRITPDRMYFFKQVLFFVLPLAILVLLLLLVKGTMVVLFQRSVLRSLFKRSQAPVLVLKGNSAHSWNPSLDELLAVHLSPPTWRKGPNLASLLHGSPLDLHRDTLQTLASLPVSDDEPVADIVVQHQGRMLQYVVRARPLQGMTGRRTGTILYFDNLSDLLDRRQKRAWSLIAHSYAHTIKSPLQAIRLNAEQIARALMEPESANFAQLLERVQNLLADSSDIQEVVQRFLSLSDDRVTRRPADPAAMIKRFSKHYRRRLPDAIRFELLHDDNLPEVEVDEYQMLVALVHLWDNAVQAQPDGGAIRTLLRCANNSLFITVEDDGPGFSLDVLRNAFEPYYSGKAGGHGLGLAHVKHILGLHDGSVQAANQETGGASITLQIPVTQMEDKTSDSSPA